MAIVGTNDFQKSVEDDALISYFHPAVDLRTERFVGVAGREHPHDLMFSPQSLFPILKTDRSINIFTAQPD